MPRDTTHRLQPQTDHDGLSRRLAVLACKTALRGPLQASLQADFESRASALERQGLSTDAQLSGEVKKRDSYRLWSGINRASQDRMWQLLAEQIDADYERILSAAQRASKRPAGSLALDEAGGIPGYQTQTPIHGQPGGYMLQRGEDDIAAGVLYEAGGNIYALGQGIGKRDSKGERLIAFIRERFPELRPARILELGCSAGGQSTDYPPAFPDAEFHAVDLSPAMLRYAHARAELLGSRVHFHRQDAGATQFADGHFDLIVSHNLFHEVAADYVHVILRECYRLLSPGGVCIHQDVPIQKDRLDGFQRFLSEWQTANNDEPFWMDFANADLPPMLIEAGFGKESVSAEYLQAVDGPIPWYVVTAVR